MAENDPFDLKLFGVLGIVFLLLFEISFQVTLPIALIFGFIVSAVLTFLVWKYREEVFDEAGPSRKIFAGALVFYLVIDLVDIALFHGFGRASLAATMIIWIIMGVVWGGVTSAVVWKLAKKK